MSFRVIVCCQFEAIYWSTNYCPLLGSRQSGKPCQTADFHLKDVVGPLQHQITKTEELQIGQQSEPGT